jgi:hypothetical protein
MIEEGVISLNSLIVFVNSFSQVPSNMAVLKFGILNDIPLKGPDKTLLLQRSFMINLNRE